MFLMAIFQEVLSNINMGISRVLVNLMQKCCKPVAWLSMGDMAELLSFMTWWPQQEIYDYSRVP